MAIFISDIRSTFSPPITANTMGVLQTKRILIFQQRGWGKRIGHFLAVKLQAEGCTLGALTFKRSTHDFVTSQKEVTYEKIYSVDEVRENPAEHLGADAVTLKQICDELEIDSVWPLAMSLRHHVRSYGDKYYYGFKQNVSDEGIADYVKAMYQLVKQIFDEFRPDVVITPNFVSLPHLLFDRLAAKRGVPMIGVSDSKVRGYAIFVHNQLENTGTFHDRLSALNAGTADSANSERARQYVKEFREKFKRPEYHDNLYKKITLWKQVKRELSPYYYSVRWLLDSNRKINYLPNLGITIDYKPPRIKLRDHYAQKRYARFMERFTFYQLDKIDKYVYFPLQVQPEATIDVRSPYFSNQIETARLIAMSLPDDYTLVVKEHPVMVGKRPPSYIEKVARTVNVKLIDYRIPSDQVLRRASLVIGPSCTTLAEAAFYRKPAIQLGNLGTTEQLPNVFKHTDMTTLSKKIKELLAVNLDTPEYERRLENYIAAAYDEGFDFNYWGVWDRGEKENMEKLWDAYKRQLKLLV